MPRKFAIFGAFLLLPGLALVAQQKPSPALPATPPTTAPAVAPPTVIFDNGLLTVTTQNSSLTQTLREIARKTNMDITGGVADERIFGTYGPARPSVVLQQLLDGTASNMLFQEATQSKAAHLTLTGRQGAPTPPSVFAANQRREEENAFMRSSPPQQNNVPRPAQPPPPQQGGVPIGSFGPPAQADGSQPAQQVSDGNDNSDQQGQQDQQQQSPNGVKTPEQLLQQLMQMRQQQSNPQ